MRACTCVLGHVPNVRAHTHTGPIGDFGLQPSSLCHRSKCRSHAPQGPYPASVWLLSPVLGLFPAYWRSSPFAGEHAAPARPFYVWGVALVASSRLSSRTYGDRLFALGNKHGTVSTRYTGFCFSPHVLELTRINANRRKGSNKMNAENCR